MSGWKFVRVPIHVLQILAGDKFRIRLPSASSVLSRDPLSSSHQSLRGSQYSLLLSVAHLPPVYRVNVSSSLRLQVFLSCKK